jgi:predicted CXXCH cytochrome family protein
VRRALVIVAIAACDSAAPVSQPPPRPPLAVESNIARADYVGPDACAGCHPDEYARWSQSLHRVMNAKASDPGAVIGNFDNAALGDAHFTRDATGFAMTIGGVHYRVTRTIGRRALQEYVGIEDGHTDEVRLPFGWWPHAGGWQPQIAFDPWLTEFDPHPTAPWAERCPWCHSTYPFEQRIARASGPTHLGHGMEQWFTSAPGGGAQNTDRLDVAAQITTGISCESCHLGGREHANGAAIHFVPHGAVARAAVPDEPFEQERRDPAIVNAICAQCHSGPSPRLVDHTALRNSSEAIDLAASPCTGIKCTDCHDPHRADARADEQRSIDACVHCHDSLADAAAARAHAGDGHGSVTCLDCHMPKLVMGIDRYVRTHRISSPTNVAILRDAQPNACNLCHLDRSLAWTADALHLDASTWPNADEPAGDRWLASPQGALRVMAAMRMNKALPNDPLAYVRAWTTKR